MTDRAKRKARQRLKREQKRKASRRAKSVSPYKLAAAGELIACYHNRGWKKIGQALFFILRRIRGGGLALAVMYVDTWCVGLKDGWVKLNATQKEFDDLVKRMNDEMDDQLVPTDIAVANAMVAAGVRFADENGFRLPPHWQRWARFVGPIDPSAADVSEFGSDGGLLWIGEMEDLRKRLIACSVEEFLARDDVHYIARPRSTSGEFVPGAPSEYRPAGQDDDDGDDWDDVDEDEDEDEEDEEFDEDEDEVGGDIAAPAAATPGQRSAHEAERIAINALQSDKFNFLNRMFARHVRRWCGDHGVPTSPHIEKAFAFLFSGSLISALLATKITLEETMDALKRCDAKDREEIEEGMEPISRYLVEHPDLGGTLSQIREEAEKRGLM